ncbi:hypothetical protein OG866_18545 [Streptomyces sp. NBC_00663]|uniref:hypothetical protein n=1 Tax=Streptomyces sp. NBC_00663 TaxID=2975801 RepID=UPI002E307ED2|nr:hypothetical protein [Streptomyces sp. NBC_00663]
MSSGSARPKRRKAAGAALRYEHVPGRPSSGAGKRRTTVGDRVFGCLVLPVFVALIMPLVFFDMYWSHDVWGDLAPAWPGGTYAFAATVGAVAPLAFLAWAAPLTRMEWKKSKQRSLSWAAASLPGLAACYLIAGVIHGAWRPKRSRRHGDCYTEGGPCRLHEQHPEAGLVGLVATVAVLALLITLFVKYGIKRSASPEESPDSPTPSTT